MDRTADPGWRGSKRCWYAGLTAARSQISLSGTSAMTRPHVRWLASSTSITWANFPSSPLSTGHPAFQSGLWRTGGMACQYLSVQRVKKLLQEARFGQGTGHDTTKRLYRPRLLDVDYVRAEYAVRSMLLRHGRRVRLFRQGGAPARLLLVDAQFRVGIRTSRPGERDTGDCSLGVGAGTPSAGVCCSV